jgi:hypothetical protein
LIATVATVITHMLVGWESGVTLGHQASGKVPLLDMLHALLQRRNRGGGRV